MERKRQQKSCIHRKQGEVPIGPDDVERATVQRRLGSSLPTVREKATAGLRLCLFLMRRINFSKNHLSQT